MVFESLVADVINRFLGSYLEKLNASQLRLGLLSGNVVLENVAVRTTAFDDLSLPVRVLHGYIGRLTLQIPFKNLYTEPVIAELDGLHILAVPNSEMEYDEEKERLYRREAKQKTLAAIDAMKLKTDTVPDDVPDSFLEKLAAQIIKNVQVKIENIHIRYEDKVSVPGLVFSAGFTLKKLAFQTCDHAKNPLSIKDESVREFYKNVELDSLAVYWNHNSKLYSNLARGVLRNVMESTIASPEQKPSAFDYIIQPISFDALLHVHMQPEKVSFKVPQLSVDVKFEEIEVSLQRNQYTGAVLFLDSIDRMILQNKFRKYKNSSQSRKPSIHRWNYAYSVVLHEVVLRRRRMWDWSYIKQHRAMVKHYIELWTKKLSKETLKPDELAKIQFYEDELDVLNLTLARQQAELKKAWKKFHRAAKRKAQEVKKSGGWFSGWFSRGSDSNQADQATGAAGEGGQIMQRVQMEMTAEEKAKLYSAIDYSEDTSRANFPADYINAILNFSLHGLTLTLNNTELSDPRIVRFQLEGLTSKIIQRSGDRAFDFSLRLGTLEAFGAKKADTGTLPILISSDSSVVVSGSRDGFQASLLTVEYSKNPLDRKADERLRVVADPLELIYDADTINRIVDFFKPPADLRLDEISSSVLPSIDEVKAMTTTGLRYMASQRTYTDVMIDVRPSCFLLPELGVYKEKCRLILLDLGSVRLRSAPAELALPRSADKQDDDQGQPSTLPGRAQSDERYKQLLQADYEQLKEQAYDRFQIELSSMQIIMVQRGEDWRQLRTQEDMSNHILRPLKIDLTLRRCIVPKEFALPLFRVDGCLPLLAVDLTDTVLESLLDIIIHIPLPEADPSLKVPTDPDALLKDVQYFPTAAANNQFSAMQVMRTANALDSEESTWYNSEESIDSESSIASSKVASRKSSGRAPRRTRKSVANLVTLDSSFRIQKTRVRVFQQSSASSDALLVLSVDEVGADIALRRWDQEIKAHVNSIKVVVPQFHERDSKEPVCLAETSQKTRANNLFSLRLLIVDKVAPNFLTEYEHTRHHLTCEFKTLKIRLHQEAILTLITFSNELVQMLSSADQVTAASAPASTADYEAEWARRLGDDEGVRLAEQRKLKLQPTHTDLRLAGSQITPMEAVTGVMSRKDERRQIRMDAAFRAAAAGQYVRIPEIDITQWKILVTLEKLKVVLCSNQLDLMSFAVRGLRLDLSITYMTTEVAVALSDVCVSDLNSDTIYKQLLWIDPGVNIFLMQLVIYSRGTNYPENADNPNKFDVAVSLQLGKAHMIILYGFVQRVIAYLEAFQTATKYAIDKASELSGEAMKQVQQAVNNPPPGRIALAVSVNAPVIYLPQHSHSSRALVFDLGSIDLNNHFERLPVPSKGPEAYLMMEMTNLMLEDLRMSAALLMDGGIKAERHVILPINLQIVLKRKVVASMDDGIPLLEVTGVLERIHLQVTHGDYKLINDVITGNFAEGQPTGASSMTVVSPTSRDGQPSGTVPNTATTTAGKPPSTEQASAVAVSTAIVADSASSSRVLDKALQFDFVLNKIDIELFSGSNSVDSWADSASEDRNLGLFNCTKLAVKGHMNKDTSADIAVYLNDLSLQDTRSVAKQHITQILSPMNQSEKSNVICVTFKQDDKENKDIDIAVCSLQICASLDYFMLLTNFFVEGAPAKTDSTVHPLELRSKPSNPPEAPSPTKVEPRKWTMRLHGRVEEPEFVLVEDMSDPNCDAVVLSTSLVLDFSMMEEEDVINASIKDLKVVACPFNRADRAENTMNVISPTSVFFYARKPIGSYLRGTVNMETLLINVNPSVIQSISKIVSSLSESATGSSVGGTNVVVDPDSLSPSHQFYPDDQFWAHKPIDPADLPTLTLISANQRPSSVATAGSSSEGCDVAKVLTEADQRREEKILVHVDYICLLMESQIGAKPMPMLSLEANVDGEIVAPSSCLAASMTVEVAVSYYNDHINEWEQLLETLPQENNRFWSLQLEFTSGDPQELFSEEEWSTLADLQTASRTLSITSQDNLEITVSKTALDVLSKLGASFEDAYRSPQRNVSSCTSPGIGTPYVLQNQTGLDLAIIIDGRRMRMVKDNTATPASVLASAASSTAELKSETASAASSGLVCHRISKFETVGFIDAALDKGSSARGLRTAQLPPPRSLSVTLAPEEASSTDTFTDRNKCADLADRSSSLRIHRTAYYVFMASRPSQSKEPVYEVPLVANISAFLGQKTLSIESTIQLVNETSDKVTIYSRRSPSGRFEPTFLTELEGGQTYCVPVEIVNNTEITGLLFGSATQPGKCSTDVLYWPETACPLPPGSPARGEAAVYLSGGSGNTSGLSLLTFGESSAGEQWPVQNINIPGVDATGRSRTFNYTVTVSPRFDDEPQFVQPRASTVAPTGGSRKKLTLAKASSTASADPPPRESKSNIQPKAYRLRIQTPASLHNLLPVPVIFEAGGIQNEIQPGNHAVLCSVHSTGFSFKMNFFYDEKDYTCSHSVSEDTRELSMITFETRDGYDVVALNLGLRCSRTPGHMDMTVYCPYWMVNKTGLRLAYKCARSIFSKKSKDKDLPAIVHPADFPGVLMFSAAARSFFGESKPAHKTATSHMYNSSSDEYDDTERFSSRLGDVQEEDGAGGNSSSLSPSLGGKQPPRRRSRRRGPLSCQCPAKAKNAKKTANSRSKSKSQRLAQKTSVILKAEASAWSSSFSLDIVGSWGRVHCEDSEDKSYEIAVKIDLSSSGLTKIITLMPYFMIVNKSPIPIECAQVRDTSEGAPGTWISVPAGGAKPFWPAAVGSKKMFMICRLDSSILTPAFQLYESHSVLLRLDNKYVGLFAEVQTTDEVTVINLQLYQEGMALVNIINNLDAGHALSFFQRGTGQTHKLEAGQRTFYAWDDASKPRQFLFYLDDPGKAKPLDVTTDGYSTFLVNKTSYYWVSFLSKLQRTVLFTNNAEEANAAAKAAEIEAIDHEVTLVFQSIGVSLVNNDRCQEVCYISIRSSDIKWNRVKNENRTKPLRPEVSAELEILYNRFLDKLRVGEKCEERITLPDHIKPQITVDLGQMVMLEPEMCSLRRTFQPGVHLQYRSSPHQMHIHAKVFRIQVDSQHLDSTFPVVFAPFQAPASMDLDSGPKPLVELIALIYRTTDKEVFRFKRLECLIQEMQCQLDQGFLNEMFDFFAGSVPEKDEITGFLMDQRSTEGELLDLPVIKDILRGGKDSIFDFLHISPIKMHVSFSLVGSQEGRQTAFHNDVLNLFLQSLGVALTDVQDVIFKLAYFERRACIMSVSKLTSEMTRHYAGQAIKQTYVLLLGLDVIGNPFGVIRGVAQGVEDLFYEPVKGAIIGTEEFGEGVALGVRSFVGHTVGGAAGAVSRITGTLGKGVAALTLDDDYKRRRREQLSRRPANFSAGLAQGGKDLVMGVVDGVTGIVMQPIGGAKKEGVGGFFKGMTKGLVGVVTRPISGVVDFASSSFEGIRRATSTSKEVSRVRPPRFIGLDGVIRPYDLYQAQGNSILKPFKDASEEYVIHVPLRKPKTVCILTSRRLLVLSFNDILGSWSCDWQISLAELDGAPTECASGLELKLLKAQRRVFGSSTISKFIEADVDQARRLQAKIVQRMSTEEAS